MTKKAGAPLTPTAAAWPGCYQNQLKSKLQSDCRFRFHDDKPSARFTDLEMTLLHEQLG